MLPVSFCLLFTVEMFGIFSHQLDFSLIYWFSNCPFHETRRYRYVPNSLCVESVQLFHQFPGTMCITPPPNPCTIIQGHSTADKIQVSQSKEPLFNPVSTFETSPQPAALLVFLLLQEYACYNERAITAIQNCGFSPQPLSAEPE